MQLPPHLVPLLDEPLDEIKRTIERVMPRQKVPTALEEAQWEDEGDDVDKHMLLQGKSVWSAWMTLSPLTIYSTR